MSISSKKAKELNTTFKWQSDSRALNWSLAQLHCLYVESGRSSVPNAGGAEMVIVTTKTIYAPDYHKRCEAMKTQSSLNYPIPQDWKNCADRSQ